MSETKVCYCCKEEKDISEFSPAKQNKSGLKGTCKDCLKIKAKVYEKNNKEIIKEKKRIYQKSYGLIIKDHKKIYREGRIDHFREVNRQYHLKNKEQRNIKCREYSKNNRDIINKLAAKRKAIKLKASKDWGELNQLIIEEAYKLSRLRSDLTGIIWHVDHIVPLQGKRVCGLHIGINLQVITAKENISKGNRFII